MNKNSHKNRRRTRKLTLNLYVICKIINDKLMTSMGFPHS